MPRNYLRKTGAAARALSPAYRERLGQYRRRHAPRLRVSSLSFPLLKTAMSAPFAWETLERAAQGKKVRANTCQFIEDFLDRVMPQPAPPAKPDRKMAAANDREPEESETLEAFRDFARRGRAAQDAVNEAVRRGSR